MRVHPDYLRVYKSETDTLSSTNPVKDPEEKPAPTAKANKSKHVPPSSRRNKRFKKFKSRCKERDERAGESSWRDYLFGILFVALFILELFHPISPLFPKPVPLPIDATASNQEAPQPSPPSPQQNSSDSGGGHLVTSFPCDPPLAPDWCRNCASFLTSNLTASDTSWQYCTFANNANPPSRISPAPPPFELEFLDQFLDEVLFYLFILESLSKLLYISRSKPVFLCTTSTQMGCPGSISRYQAAGAKQVKAWLKCVFALHVAAGRPFGATCPVVSDWQTVAHLFDLSTLKTYYLRLLWRIQYEPGANISAFDRGQVLAQLEVLATDAMTAFKVPGVHTTFLVETGPPRFGKLWLFLVFIFAESFNFLGHLPGPFNFIIPQCNQGKGSRAASCRCAKAY